MDSKNANVQSLPNEKPRSAYAYSLSNLFVGNPKGFYQRHDDGRYVAVHREATVLDFLDHLSGDPNPGLLSIPLLPDGNCHWGSLDIDRHGETDPPVDWPSLARQITELNLPLVACASKDGKGAHLFIFFKEDGGVPAQDVRRILAHYAELLTLGNVEIFPKQKDLDTQKKLGSGINLPYRGVSRWTPECHETLAYGKDGEPLDTAEFIDLANERKAYGSLLIHRLAAAPDAPSSVPRDSESRQTHPMSLETARRIHADNLAALRAAKIGEGNALLNTTSFFAGRAFAAHAFEQSEAQLRDEILKIVTKEWAKPHPTSSALSTIKSGWDDGIKQPVKLIEEEEVEIRPWPEPPAEEAFAGLVGDFVELWQNHTEASPVALAAQFITFFGHSVGRTPFFAVGGDDHHTNLEIVLVGPTSFGRKGQSYGCVRHQFDKVDLGLAPRPFIEVRGLSSGEGLIFVVRDPRSEPNKKGESVVVDHGVTDKRVLVFESEFASVLRRMVRENNTLSEIMRQAWDTGDLGTMTKATPTRATNAHISVITHVTPSDLQLYLNDVSTMNGFANRFIFLATRRVRLLPDPGRPSEDALREFSVRLAQVIEFGREVGEMKRSPQAGEVWKDLYAKLSEARTGRQHNAVVARAPAHVLRLSMIYALLNGSSIVGSSASG